MPDYRIPQGFKFAFKPLPLLLAVIVFVGTILLGNWQTRRAEGKIAMQQNYRAAAQVAPLPVSAADLGGSDHAPWLHKNILLTGNWLPDQAIYLDNRPAHGQAGFYALVPLQLAGPDKLVVLVNRGWLPRDPANRSHLLPYTTPAGQVNVAGYALDDEQRLMELGQAPPSMIGGIWQNLSFDKYQAASGLHVARLVVRQSPEPRLVDGLARDWPDEGSELQGQIDRHRGYAFQWYAFAALTLVLTIYFGMIRNARNAKNTNTAATDHAA